MLKEVDTQEITRMVQEEQLDIRTVTMGISLLDCICEDISITCDRVYEKITSKASNLVNTAKKVEERYGIPVVNKRISVTPASMVVASVKDVDFVLFAKILQKAADAVGVDFIGGFSALVHKGFCTGEEKFIRCIPEVLAQTKSLCASVNIGSTRSGINMDAVKIMGEVIIQTAECTSNDNCFGPAKLVVFCNAPEDNPFMAGAFHGVGEPDCEIHVGVSGPGVVRAAVEKFPDAPFDTIAEVVRFSSFKITRIGQLVGEEVSRSLGVPFGIVDLSLAPTPTRGDSVAEVLESMGLSTCGMHGTTAALALLNDSIKKGGVMASTNVGGLSGSFIPVSEDLGMIDATNKGVLSLEKLEAMTAVCSVGLDMVVIPGDTPASTISAIIADEAAIGMINNKTTAVRIIPAVGKKEGDMLEFGGLFGRGPVMSVCRESAEKFVSRGGRIPAPIHSLKN